MGKLNFCFIRKNTPEIQERLRKLGIPQNNFDEGNRPWIAYNHGLWISVDEGHDRLFRGDIDCGDSEDLFFALVTLQDDKQDYQWFVWDANEDGGDKFKQYIPGEHWEEWWWFEVHKATVEELIQHFKSE
jgi:hypothetical protein